MMDDVQREDSHEPQPRLVISDLETVRILADPLRVRILELTVERPRTVKQLAATLNTTPTKLYYHINTLEQHGLLKVAGTRLVSGIVEKQYRVVARNIGMDPELLSPSSMSKEEVIDLAVASVFDTARMDIESLREDLAGDEQIWTREPLQRGIAVMRTMGRLSPEQVPEFHRRLLDLITELGKNEPAGEGAKTFSLTIMMYPLRQSPPDEQAGADDG